MRVVFDTNIFISALTLPGGNADAAIMRIVNDNDTLVISREIIDEILTVLARKFSKDAEALSRVAVNLAGLGEMVYPTGRLTVLEDAADNRILECAVEGNAVLIVTGDKTMLMLKRHRDIKIVTLSDFLKH
ncbi:MAG TPA: putative toxin-antitoxin system toxin component, PIN family [Nitrospiraceae bacterium]|nr:putative toxin-antitoxin system toxin component, PIN family [Nitrospiraceae bacterium]